MNPKQMLEWVQMLGFCVVDMQLYLDTHPEDMEAFAYFKEAVAAYKKAVHQYEETCGPLTAAAAAKSNKYTWADMPMPWEGVR